MKKLISIITLTLLIAACNKSPVTPNINQENPEAAEQETNQEETTQEQPQTTQAQLQAAQYIDYSPEKLAELEANNQAYVVFFHADWCPTCKAIEANILPEISSFPDGTVILKANYDNEKELKRRFNITYQSTIAVVDTNQNHLTTLLSPENDVLKAAIEDSLSS